MGAALDVITGGSDIVMRHSEPIRRRDRRWPPIGAGSAAASLLPLLSGCSTLAHGFLGAAGPVTADQRHIYLIVCVVMVFVAGPVMLLAPAFAWYFRASNSRSAYRPAWTFSWIVEGLIWIPPSLIVIGLAVLLWRGTHRLDPYRPVAGGPPLDVQVIAYDWKWLFLYPATGIASVNRLVVPVGQPVRLHLTSATVMKSILIPRLGGQIYLMGGMTTDFNFRADRPDRYRGENTQYSGTGFPYDRFTVDALPPADYDRWLAKARHARPLDAAMLRRIEARSIATHPVTLSRAPADLFDHVRMATAGGASMAMPR